MKSLKIVFVIGAIFLSSQIFAQYKTVSSSNNSGVTITLKYKAESSSSYAHYKYYVKNNTNVTKKVTLHVCWRTASGLLVKREIRDTFYLKPYKQHDSGELYPPNGAEMIRLENFTVENY